MDANVIGRRRAVPVALAVLVALLLGLLVTAAPRATAAGDRPAGHAGPAGHSAGLVAADRLRSPAAFHDTMRRLWEDHITWTRLAIVTFADGSAGFDATAARLLRNQTDIGDAVKPFYGRAAGNRLTALLRGHITTAVELLQAAKAGDVAAFAAAKRRWYGNADDIAGFLAKANPRFWPRSMMRADMRTHLDQTLAEAGDELHGDYPASVRDYEAIHRHILAMADMLSSGIIKQFPHRFR